MKKIFSYLFWGTILFLSVGCSGYLHDEKQEGVTLTIQIKEDNGYEKSTLIIENAPVKEGSEIEGSLFNWGVGGSPVKVPAKLEIEANCKYVGAWIANESPFTKKGYPKGADYSAKFKLNGEEGWVCFKAKGKYTFDWTKREKD